MIVALGNRLAPSASPPKKEVVFTSCFGCFPLLTWVGALRATTEAGEARSRLRRLVARPVGGLVNKFPVRRQARAPTPSGPPRLAGHGSPPFQRDTEKHGKVPD